MIQTYFPFTSSQHHISFQQQQSRVPSCKKISTINLSNFVTLQSYYLIRKYFLLSVCSVLFYFFFTFSNYIFVLHFQSAFQFFWFLCFVCIFFLVFCFLFFCSFLCSFFVFFFILFLSRLTFVTVMPFIWLTKHYMV